MGLVRNILWIEFFLYSLTLSRDNINSAYINNLACNNLLLHVHVELEQFDSIYLKDKIIL